MFPVIFYNNKNYYVKELLDMLKSDKFFDRAPIDEGMKQEVVIDRNIVTADGLAVDWVYSHLYWTDTGTNSITMSDLDGNLISTIIKDDLEEPRAIALHPSKG